MSTHSLSSNEGLSEKEKHLRLAHVIKGVHSHLRKKYRECGDYEKVWQDHKENKEVLSQYADAMHSLATEHWTKKPETRIDWCRDTCIAYFYDDGLRKCLDKEKRRKAYEDAASAEANSLQQSDASIFYLPASDGVVEEDGNLPIIPVGCSNDVDLLALEGETEFMPVSRNSTFSDVLDSYSDSRDNTAGSSHNVGSPSYSGNSLEHIDSALLDKDEVYSKYSPVKYNTITLPFKDRIRLLDVGSCFNPFKQFEEFVSIGVDISPAVESVYCCDFLSLELTDPLQLASDSVDTYLHGLRSPIEKLPHQCFHVIVFSLLLEYFPSTYQRWLCCQKAHELLLVNGLLLIITPDSHSQHRNAPMMKSWKVGIESLGFVRCKYVKQEHLHCLAFRKVIKDEPENDLVSEVGPENLYIPQDFNNADEEASSNCILRNIVRSDEEDLFIRDQFSELPADID